MTRDKLVHSSRAGRGVDVQFTPKPLSEVSAKPSRKRGLASMFAVMGVVAFAGACAIPAAAAISTAAPQPTTNAYLYDAAVAGAQLMTVRSDVVTTAFNRPETSYEAYVTPTPTPTPTPEPEPEPASASESSSSDGGSGDSGDSGYSEPVEEEYTAPAAPEYSGGGSKEDWMAAAGIAPSDYAYVDYIVSRESGWNPNATNSSSGACGLVQVYPCEKLDNAKDPIVNLSWANGYATSRYGSWAGAYEFWSNNHWW